MPCSFLRVLFIRAPASFMSVSMPCMGFNAYTYDIKKPLTAVKGKPHTPYKQRCFLTLLDGGRCLVSCRSVTTPKGRTDTSYLEVLAALVALVAALVVRLMFCSTTSAACSAVLITAPVAAFTLASFNSAAWRMVLNALSAKLPKETTLDFSNAIAPSEPAGAVLANWSTHSPACC